MLKEIQGQMFGSARGAMGGWWNYKGVYVDDSLLFAQKYAI